MSFANCAKCGKLFQKMLHPVCDKCIQDEEKMFDQIKIYIDENPGASLPEISEATGASAKKLLKYLREGRLMPTGGMGLLLDCESCGKKIGYGRYCEPCSIDVRNKVTQAFTKKASSGMHTSR